MGSRLKQPTADKEETRQTKQEEHGIEAQQGIAETEMADMRIDDENHRKSSHRINVFNSLCSHFDCKNTQNISISCRINKNIVSLHHEREINMD